jgi:hypothetical protein
MSNYEESSFVLTLPMNTTDFHISSFDKIFEVSRKVQNACLREILKRNQLVQDNKQYQKNMRCIKAINSKNQMSKNKKEIKFLEKELRSMYNKQKEIEHSIGLSEYAIHDFVVPMKRNFEGVLDINTAQSMKPMITKEKTPSTMKPSGKIYCSTGFIFRIFNKKHKNNVTQN